MEQTDSRSELSGVVVAARDAVIDAMEHGVVVLDRQSSVLDMNPAAEEILGQRATDVVGKPVSPLLSKWGGLLGLLEDRGEGEAEITVELGTRKCVFQAVLSPLHDSEESRLGRFILLRDITERKHAERALREAKVAAEASDQAKSEFMSVASHEMRTPITSIKGYADLLSRGTVGPINETQAEFLDTIRANADRIALLVSDLSDIARIESGRLRLELTTVDIGEVVREAVEGLRTQIEEKNQTLCVDVPDGLVPVRADYERSVQILSNLISNAHKFTPMGGRIVISVERWQVGRGEESVLVSVEDDGIGIRSEEQDKVFEKFYRSEDREASDQPGSGLGLSIAANLVEMQGGRIWMESAFRVGTTVGFSLPAASQRQQG